MHMAELSSSSRQAAHTLSPSLSSTHTHSFSLFAFFPLSLLISFVRFHFIACPAAVRRVVYATHSTHTRT